MRFTAQSELIVLLGLVLILLLLLRTILGHHRGIRQARRPEPTKPAPAEAKQAATPPETVTAGGWRPPVDSDETDRPHPHDPDAGSISGEIRKFSFLGGQNGPMAWNFRIQRYDPDTGERLGEVAVEMKYLTKGILTDGDNVTAYGQFDRSGLFQATRVVNHSAGTDFQTSPVRQLLGCFYVLFGIMFCGVLSVFAIIIYHLAVGH
jgi:hypothetical protein